MQQHHPFPSILLSCPTLPTLRRCVRLSFFLGHSLRSRARGLSVSTSLAAGGRGAEVGIQEKGALVLAVFFWREVAAVLCLAVAQGHPEFYRISPQNFRKLQITEYSYGFESLTPRGPFLGSTTTIASVAFDWTF